MNAGRDRFGLTGGVPNPDWLEWMMGLPIGWTAPGALATDRFQAWCRLHGITSALTD
jgi:hypothetical protein